MSTKKIGMQDGREFFEGKIRRGHEAEDINEIIKLQESTIGKKRFKIYMDDFSTEEAETIIKVMHAMNYYRNTYVRKSNPIIYTNTELHV